MKKKEINKRKNERLTTLFLVSPCFNEENVLPTTYSIFLEKLDNLIKQKVISKNSRVLFVNDGSLDSTWNIIQDLSRKSKYIEGISLSRNRGHQNALLAGLMEAKELCDVTITLDCDGQHDISAVDAFMEKYHEGYDVVYGVRNNRAGDSLFKRFFSEFYYRLLRFLGGEIIINHADYRLVSSKVLKELEHFGEVNIFLRGLFPIVGFRSTTINYEQFERVSGKSHYSLSRMLTLAIDGITSLSIKPIRIITIFGLITMFFSIIGFMTSLIRHDALWTATSIVCFLCGVIIECLGIVGEYVGKTYLEAKHRPRYIVDERTY